MSACVPSLEEARAMRGQGNVVPVYRDVAADLETPVSAYLKVARGPYSFLLESVEGGERLARYSFIGTEPYRVVRTGGRDGEADPLIAIEDELRRFQPVRVPGLPRFHGGAVGYMAYEVARYYEKLPMPEADPQGFPESVFMFTDTLLVFDHLQHTIKIVSHARLDGDIDAAYAQAVRKINELAERLAQPLARLPYERRRNEGVDRAVKSNTTEEDFKRKVERAKEYIYRGDTYQVQVSQRFERHTPAHPFEAYRALRTVNPSPYMYYLALDDMHVVGASPEMLIRVEDGVIETHPIAGTRRRGRDAEDEQRMAEELQTSEKERAEHIMLVDLARNDLGRVCEAGTVRVTSLMAIERYSHVMHMVSHVVGKLRNNVTTYDALRAYFPHGTVTGAPKIRTMEIIAELEGERRGGYGGCVAYFDMSGSCDSALSIRTIWMKHGSEAGHVPGVAYVQAAGGVVFDSTPEEEYMESGNKARAMLRAIDLAEQREDARAAAAPENA